MRYLLLIGNGPVQNNTNYDNDIEDFATSDVHRHLPNMTNQEMLIFG